MNEDRPLGHTDAMQHRVSLLEAFATHPFGIIGGALAGAAIGLIGGMGAGPLGSLIGVVAGAIVGGAIGSSFRGEPTVDMAAEDRYWRDRFTSCPYVPAGADYADYGPAYRYGAQAWLHNQRLHTWSEVEPLLRKDWERCREGSRLSWEQAKAAVQDAWEHLRQSPR